MLLPTTYALTLALLVISVICWGSWANTLKKAQWRFELFYIDYCFGALLAALVAAFTVGSMGPDLSVQDSFLLVAKRPILTAFVAGCIFNLANMLLVASIEVAGMGIAFTITFGLALIVNVIWNYVAQSNGSLLTILCGSLLILIAVVLAAVAQGMLEGARRKSAAALKAAQTPADDQAKAALAGGRKRRPEADTGPGALLGVWLAIAGGILMGTFYPVAAISMEGELGFSNPFSVTLLVSIGMLVSTIIYNLYFMNLPVKGAPISFFAYFTGKLSQHAMGILGGIIWMTGACAVFAAAAAQGEAKIGTAFAYAVSFSAAMVSLIWGALVWKEFADAPKGASRLILIMALLLTVGLALLANSQRA